jgi:hypothetical protein
MARDARKEEMIALKITPKFNRGLSPINARQRSLGLYGDHVLHLKVREE